MIYDNRNEPIDRDAPSVIKRLQAATTFIFDVDGTLVTRQGSLQESLADLLVQSGKTLGIATSRAVDELDEVFPSPEARELLFTGPVVLEDGGVIIHGGKKQLRVLPEHAAAVFQLRDELIKELILPEEGELWSRVTMLNGPLIHIPAQYDYKTSFSIWQQAPEGSLTAVHLRQTMDWCKAVVDRLSIGDKVQLLEIGDGTLRVSAPGQSKGAALAYLHDTEVIDLTHTVYFGDGANDVVAAQRVKERGGTVIAADPRCRELTAIADFHHPTLRGPEVLEYLLLRLL